MRKSSFVVEGQSYSRALPAAEIRRLRRVVLSALLGELSADEVREYVHLKSRDLDVAVEGHARLAEKLRKARQGATQQEIRG